MSDRRLVGIDLGIASAHTVRVLDGEGKTLAKRKAWPTVESLTEVEAAALAGCPAAARLEVVVEPTGPAWLPIAVFFARRGHAVYRVSSAKAADLRRFFSRHTKTNGIDADTLARLPLVDPDGLEPLVLPRAKQAALDRRVRATDRLTQAAARHKVRIKDLARQLMPMSPLTGELGAADLAVLERWADPRQLVKAGHKHLTGVIAKASNNHLGAERATEWLAAAQAALDLYGDDPAVALFDLAAEVASEVRLVRATQRDLAAHSAERERCYCWVHPGALARSLPGLGRRRRSCRRRRQGDPARFHYGRQFRSFTGLVPKANETGDSDRKGQSMSKAGFVLAARHLHPRCRHRPQAGPQLARIYWTQMVERGKDHLGALCVAAADLAERTWAVLDRRMPYVSCDNDGNPGHPSRGQGHHRREMDRPSRRPSSPAPQEGERPPRKSSQDIRGRTLKAPANGATFPIRHPRRPPAEPSNPQTPVPEKNRLTTGSSIGAHVEPDIADLGARPEPFMVRGTLCTLRRGCGKATCHCATESAHESPALAYPEGGGIRTMTLSEGAKSMPCGPPSTTRRGPRCGPGPAIGAAPGEQRPVRCRPHAEQRWGPFPDAGAFGGSRACFEDVLGWLEGTEAGSLSHDELEDVLDRRGQELLRRLLQDHLDPAGPSTCSPPTMVTTRHRRHGPKRSGSPQAWSKTPPRWWPASLTRPSRRDLDHRRTWGALVDGNNHQIDRTHDEVKTRRVSVTIVVDLIHVIEYLWGAVWCFFTESRTQMS